MQVRLMPSRQCRPTENPFWYGPSQEPPGQRKDQRARSARASGARDAAEGEHPPIPQPLGPLTAFEEGYQAAAFNGVGSK